MTSGSDLILRTHEGVPITPKTLSQYNLVEAARRSDVVFALGPAGTGKSFLAVALALAALEEKHIHRVVLTRPAVEAGESLGFLPGGLREKLDPYMRPLYDALHAMLGHERTEAQIASGTIEIAPLAYLRGRTLSKAFVILDEAQNATHAQLKMLLTRLGPRARVIINGDPSQIDLPDWHSSCLHDAHEILARIHGIEFVRMDPADVVRHRLVTHILRAYEAHVRDRRGGREGDAAAAAVPGGRP